MAVSEAGGDAARTAALAEARAGVRDAALRGLCREGREAVAADVLRGHGVADAERTAARLAAESDGPERRPG